MKPKATRDAYGEALRDLGRENSRIVALDADLSSSTRSGWFAQEFPDRFFNAGIAEGNMIGLAAGMALAGKIPFVSTFAIFATGRTWEQIRQIVAYPNLNVKIAGSHAGLMVGADGASHQALEDIAIMRALPNMTVISPADAIEAAQAVRAVAEHDGPAYLRLGRAPVPLVVGENYQFKIGRNCTLMPGNDVTIFATGVMVDRALQAAEALRERQIEAEVVNVSSIKPIDVDGIVASAERTGTVVTAEEHNVVGGLGSAVAAVLAQHCPVPVEMVGVQDVFGQSGSPEELLELYGLTPLAIEEAAVHAVQRKLTGGRRQSGRKRVPLNSH